jgi:hypothetical protein
MKFIFYFLLGLAFLSCSPTIRKQTFVPVISMDADRIETLKLSDLFAHVSYIPLSDSCLVGSVERAKILEMVPANIFPYMICSMIQMKIRLSYWI